MTALAQERIPDFFGLFPARRTVPMKANVKIFKGAMVAIDASGNAQPAGLLAGGSVRVIGIAAATFDNSTGIAGALKAEVQVGVFKCLNNGGELVVAASVGAPCYVLDDQTVSLTAAGATRPIAGLVQAVESDGGVRVYFA